MKYCTVVYNVQYFCPQVICFSLCSIDGVICFKLLASITVNCALTLHVDYALFIIISLPYTVANNSGYSNGYVLQLCI